MNMTEVMESLLIILAAGCLAKLYRQPIVHNKCQILATKKKNKILIDTECFDKYDKQRIQKKCIRK